MVAEDNLPCYQFVEVEIPNRVRSSMIDPPLQHLIEVAVIQRPIITYTDDTAAHDTFGSNGIECVDEFCHVHVVQVCPFKKMLETIDRHVRHDIQTIELQTIALSQFSFELTLNCGLIRWQVRADRIVDKIQNKRRAFLSITECVESAHGFNALLKDALPTLRISFMFLKVWQG